MASMRPPESVEKPARRLAQASPLVQCITNVVASPLSANVLAALGASPAMMDNPGEAGPFAAIAQGLLVNIGTMTIAQRAGAFEAISTTSAPWVLDPVAAGTVDFRLATAQNFARMHPAVIRGNISEIETLATGSSVGKGVDAVETSSDPAHIALAVAEEYGAVVAISGATDTIADPNGTIEYVSGGNVAVTTVVGTGCALGAAFAAAVPTAPTVFEGVVAMSRIYKWAAEYAAEHAEGPGTFAAYFLDGLQAARSTQDDA